MKIVVNKNGSLKVRDQADYLENELLSRVACEVYEAVENLTVGNGVYINNTTMVSRLSDIVDINREVNLPGFKMDVVVCTDRHDPTLAFRKQWKDWVDDIKSDCPKWENLKVLGREVYAPPLVVIDLLMAQAKAEQAITFLDHADWEQTINNLSVLRAAVEESGNE